MPVLKLEELFISCLARCIVPPNKHADIKQDETMKTPTPGKRFSANCLYFMPFSLSMCPERGAVYQEPSARKKSYANVNMIVPKILKTTRKDLAHLASLLLVVNTPITNS